MEALFLGIDAGTTTIKAVLFDMTGRELAITRNLPYPDFAKNGYVTQNMESHWKIVTKTIREIVEKSREYGEIKAIGITGQGDGIWLVGEDGKPVEDAILWVDGRAGEYIKKWEEEKIIGRSGRVVFNGSMMSLAAWMYDHKPEVMKKTKKALFCKDWIKYCLTGEMVTDSSDLSDASLVEVENPTYNGEHLETFGVGEFLEKLPKIARGDTIIGTVNRQAAEQTGLVEGTPVINGMIDIVATPVGNGVTENHMACSIVGTTLFNEIASDSLAHLRDERYSSVSVVCGMNSRQWYITLGTMAGAPNLDWFLREFYTNNGKQVPFSKLEDIVLSIPAGSDGVIYHPYIGAGGERAPFVKPSACAQFSGLKSTHTKAHMLRAVYEGVALSMKDCYENFPIIPEVVRLAGGGSNSEQWVQIFCNNINIPIEITNGTESGARGVALTAATSAGYFASQQEAISAMIRVKKKFEPEAEKVEIYNQNYQVYTEIYKGMWNAWDEHQKTCQR